MRRISRNVPAPVGLDRADGALRFGERPTGRLPAIGIRSAAAAGHARPAYLRVDLDLDGLADLVVAFMTLMDMDDMPTSVGRSPTSCGSGRNPTQRKCTIRSALRASAP